MSAHQKLVLKRRAFVAAFLGAAAIGTHWLPGRNIVESNANAQQVTVATADNMVVGSNSLLGDRSWLGQWDAYRSK